MLILNDEHSLAASAEAACFSRPGSVRSSGSAGFVAEPRSPALDPAAGGGGFGAGAGLNGFGSGLEFPALGDGPGFSESTLPDKVTRGWFSWLDGSGGIALCVTRGARSLSWRDVFRVGVPGGRLCNFALMTLTPRPNEHAGRWRPPQPVFQARSTESREGATVGTGQVRVGFWRGGKLGFKCGMFLENGVPAQRGSHLPCTRAREEERL